MNHPPQHAIIILAALRVEALANRLDDEALREYTLDLTRNLNLPEPVKTA